MSAISLNIKTPRKIGNLLVELNLISQKDLESALETQRKDGGRLGEILIKQGLIDQETLNSALSNQLNVPEVDLKEEKIQPEALSLIPEEIAHKYTLIPLHVDDDTITVAMAFPDDVLILRDLTMRTGKKVRVVLASAAQINGAIDLNYRSSQEIESSLKQMTTANGVKSESDQEITAQTPIAMSLNLMLQQAVKDRASDVHIEPQGDKVRVRFRIDGILHTVYTLPISVHGALVSRIKILSEMNIAEQRRSQDGQFSIQVGSKEIDIRAATMSIAGGERVALRILDHTLTPLSLEDIGFLPDQLDKFRKLLSSSFGVILVGGPTGSGKTTTLYAALRQFNPEYQNIITIEDPVEYTFTNINQSQINTKAGITFATGLRTILRHDPDVVLVGEVRDRETATIVTQTALTGRLVLATIHANDAISILFRLIDLGIEPYLIAPTLVGAVAQRMVRRICPFCKTKSDVSVVEETAYSRELGEKPKNMFKGKGCNMCANTGYRGRITLNEVLVMSEDLRRRVLTGANSDEIKNAALKEGMLTMQRDGMLKAKQGLTTISEVLRIAYSGLS
jgi:type II secretory ATPase GspE/PulE/Tfp pilus assembly ATPase PilB-like protein